jgi:threonine/homoserine/homoserine lactone efflux protein
MGNNWTIFLMASLILLVVPGPAVLFIVARSLDRGTRGGLVTVLGISLGTIAHILVTAFGLAAVMSTTPLAFQVIKYGGAAYLVYIGVRQLLPSSGGRRPEQSTAGQNRRLFWDGFLVNLLNPKAMLFFFAFLPQFADPARGNLTLQLLLLGGVFLAMALLSDSLYALLAGRIAGWLRSRPAIFRWQRYLSSAILIALGIFTAFSQL